MYFFISLIVLNPNYGLGEELVLTVVFVSVLLEAAGDSFTTVVLFSVFFSPPGGLATVVSFCSHPVSNAAPASMQMYFFMICLWETQCGSKTESEQDKVSVLHKKVFQSAGSYLSPCASATASIVNFPSRVLIPPRRVGCFSQAPAKP